MITVLTLTCIAVLVGMRIRDNHSEETGDMIENVLMVAGLAGATICMLHAFIS